MANNPEQGGKLIDCTDVFPGREDGKTSEQLAPEEPNLMAEEESDLVANCENNAGQSKTVQEREMLKLYSEVVLPYLNSPEDLLLDEKKALAIAKQIVACLKAKQSLPGELTNRESILLTTAEAITNHIDPSLRNSTREEVKKTSL